MAYSTRMAHLAPAVGGCRWMLQLISPPSSTRSTTLKFVKGSLSQVRLGKDTLSTSGMALMSYVSALEEGFDHEWARHWVEENWGWLCLSVSVTYIGLVFQGKAWMEDRAPFHLRGPLALWSAGLAVFSIIGFARTAPELAATLAAGGLEGAVCRTSLDNRAMVAWSWLFTVSKLVELGDTLFIVLRKQRLLFLHW